AGTLVQTRRQERPRTRGSAARSRQGAPQVRGLPTLPHLRAPAFRAAPRPLRPEARLRAQGQRRLHRSALPAAPPRAPPLPQRAAVVENGSDRPAPHRPRTLGGNPAQGHAAARQRDVGSSVQRFAGFVAPNRRGAEGGRRRKTPSYPGGRRRVEGPMTSLRQIEANRHNALKSTGPKTENGKQRSRRNALRHGFTAETVIEPLESPDEYRVFEDAIVSEYLPQTPVEQ